MNKTLIIESCEKRINEDFSNTSIVHVRNSMIIAKEVGCDLVSHDSQIDMNKIYDNIICAYASPYMKYKKYLPILLSNPNAKMYWMVNDHDLEDNILLRNWVLETNKQYNVICNNPRSGYRHWILAKNINNKKLNDYINNWYTINLNCLVFNQLANVAPSNDLFARKKSGCIYFGTFRKHRSEDMLRYNGADYTISTSTKNQIKYKDANISANFIDKIGWRIGNEDLANYKYSIYFEDKHTHDNYAFMANRYYECLMCNVLMFFDYKCSLVMERSGYKIAPSMIVKNGSDLNDTIKELDNDSVTFQYLLEIQRSNIPLIIKERSEVLLTLKNIFVTT